MMMMMMNMIPKTNASDANVLWNEKCFSFAATIFGPNIDAAGAAAAGYLTNTLGG